MNWYYESGGQQQGPVADSELDRLLAARTITPDTLVWREGMAGWTPLRTARPAAPPAAAERDAGWEVTRPGAPAAASAGSDAPQPGWVRCTLTGRYFPQSEIITIEGKPYCAAAKPQVVASLEAGAAIPVSGEGRDGPAWEQRSILGLVKAVVETVKAVLINPVGCFSKMKCEGGLGTPLTYLLLTSGIGFVANGIYTVIFQGAMLSWIARMNGPNAPAPPTGLMFGGGVLGGIIGIPILLAFALLCAFVWAGLVHLSLNLLHGANRPYETTLRTVCYCAGTGLLFYVIPFCGGLIGLLWALVALCIGVGKAHDTSTERGVAATLIPFGVCCIGGITIYVAVVASLVQSMKSAGGM